MKLKLNEMKWKTWAIFFYIVMGSILLIFFVLDIAVCCDIFKVRYYVDVEYNHSLFSAIITLSTFFFTIISIVIGIANTEVSGIKLKEIMKFKKSPVKIEKMIVSFLILDVFSVIALTLNFVMFITTIFVVDLFLTAFYTGKILLIVTNEERVKKIIDHEVLCNPNVFREKYISNWISKLKDALIDKNIKLRDDYISLLKKIGVDKHCNDQLQENLPEIFKISCDAFGITESIKLILSLNNDKAEEFDFYGIVQSYFDSIKLKDEKTFQNLKIPGTISDVVESNQINDEQKISVLYWFFNSIFNNSVINDKYKQTLISTYLNSLHYLYDKGNEGEIRCTVSLYILKNCILLNDNYVEAENLYKQYISSLASKNILSSEKCYVKLIAFILRAFYFYIYFDNSISITQKKSLKHIFRKIFKTIEGVTLNLRNIVYSCSEKILEYLVVSAFYDAEYHDIMDHFSPLLGIREVVWSNKNKMRFAFCFYIVFNYDYDSFPISDYIDCEKIKNSDIELLKYIAEFYDTTNHKLKHSICKDIDNLVYLINITNKYSVDYISDVFDSINSLLKSITKKTLDSVERKPKEYIVNKIPERISKIIVGVNISEQKFDNTEKFYLNPLILREDENFDNIIINRISRAIVEILNTKMDDALLPLNLSFNKDGILELAQKIKRYNYKLCNYKYIDDWAFGRDIRNTTEYLELQQLINHIKIVQTKGINHRFFIKEDKLEMYYCVDEINYEKANDSDADKYIQNYKVSNNLYKIDNVLYNRKEAMEYVKNYCKIVYATVQVGININKGSGYKITR